MPDPLESAAEEHSSYKEGPLVQTQLRPPDQVTHESVLRVKGQLGAKGIRLEQSSRVGWSRAVLASIPGSLWLSLAAHGHTCPSRSAAMMAAVFVRTPRLVAGRTSAIS